MTTSTMASPPSELARLSVDELRVRRGVLAQGMQGAVLEGLPVDDDDAREVAALDAELRRRSGGA